MTALAFVCLALAAFFATAAGSAQAADEKIVIGREKDPNGFAKPVPVHISGFSGEAESILRNDLIFMGISNTTADQALYLVSGTVSTRVEGHVSSAATKAHLFGNAYSGGTTRRQIHAFADDVARLLTGVAGIAQTRMCFKAEQGPGRSEVYVGDYDGFGAQPVTHDGNIVAGPCWWSKRDGLVYCTYKLGTPQIFSHNLASGARTPVARYPGGNYSPAVSPDGTKVAMILSKGGNPDLYVSNMAGKHF